ncbi:unnamed protein product [Chilo suppressalis]|uniref:Uncharacterized protein n=1 Tax=Chilo suppressalis TaxID=168631 RepID=A0ABN8AZ59_CHISP|nr:unnamed protein product [Chilo suppressalis]
MSQKTSRKGVVTEEKEKRQTDSPVKDMKKKMAANAEKEKQTAEKSVEKVEKPVEKVDKPAEKSEKTAEKKTDKVEKKPEPEKKEDSNKDDKAAKSEKSEAKSTKPKSNGTARVNGTASNGDHNGTVSATPDYEDVDEEDEGEGDEMFPELTYDDTSDPEFEPDAPHGRSITRRSQAKVTRTPETPRPASQRNNEPVDDSKDSKVLKLKEDVPSTDRKLRSADSPKPDDKKQQQSKPEPAKKPQESQEKPQEVSKKSLETPQKKEESVKKSPESQDKAQESSKKMQDSPKKQQETSKQQGNETKEKKEGEEKENGDDKVVVIEVVEIDDEEEPRKTDTNFSKSRVKVSPYRRSMRADHTASSTMANYTGNNTTMEMDFTESSFSTTTDVSLDDSSYLGSLRNIRGRRSYKQLKEMTLRHVTEKQHRPNTSGSASEQPARPTGTVVGRKRKPDGDMETGVEPAASEAGKRMRLFDRLTHSLRTTTLPALPARRNAEIVGINTDLPLTAPVASTETFDPETLKATSTPTPSTNPDPIPVSPIESDKDNKRCIVM